MKISKKAWIVYRINENPVNAEVIYASTRGKAIVAYQLYDKVPFLELKALRIPAHDFIIKDGKEERWKDFKERTIREIKSSSDIIL